ncbi:MAG: sensor histidine kinase [Faecousia sp.]
MFKKTRRKIVAAIMCVLAFLFVGMLAVIYAFSYQDTLRENQKMLERHASQYVLGGASDTPQRPDGTSAPGGKDRRDPEFGGALQPEPALEDSPQYQLSAFYSVAMDSDGTVLATENPNGVYTDEELAQIAQKVYAKTRTSGTVGSLIFYKADKGNYTLVAFMDNTIVMNSLSTLFKYTLVWGSLTMVLLFFLARQLAKRILRPLEESYTRQKQFISDAGHELKTPVTVVSANAELLSRQIGDNPWLSNIQYENQRMGALVTQLLELARTENTAPPMEEVDFSRLVQGETLAFESVAFEKGMRLCSEMEETLRVWGNSGQLRQLVSILLDNAVHHATGAGEILLTLKGERSHAVLSVINDADEIPPETQKQLFERFYRGDAARSGEDGHYGLGLSIAKAIVTAHKGKIDVACRDGKVEFTVQLPLLK